MKKIIPIFCLLIINEITVAQNNYTPSFENLQSRKEFQDMKLGMFIHWGASSVLGHGEWVMNERNIKVNDYNKLINIFNPQNFDAKKWVAAAKSAGMKYITFITRHHDGFSNWDTKENNWKITATPYGKDVLKQLADECHKEGIKLFCYYSLLDWYHPDYQYETGRTGKGTGRTAKSNWENYIRFMKAQLTEILTNYGEISGIWFDGHWDQLKNYVNKSLPSQVNWHYDEIYELIHKLQPKCLISNNHHLEPIPGEDFQAFEKDLPGHNTTGFGGASVSALPLETCETMNNSWGYNITDLNYKSKKALVQYLVKAAGLNANFLLNVGPMADGTIQQEFIDTLKAVGDCMKVYGETIYETRGAIVGNQDWGTITSKANKYYLHILRKPSTPNYLFIPDFSKKIITCTSFVTKEKIKFKQQNEGVFFYVNNALYDTIDTIIEFEIK